MVIHVVKSGGLAGLRYERRVDTADLMPGMAAVIEQAVTGYDFFGLASAHAGTSRDAYVYRVRVELDGRVHEIVFPDEERYAGPRTIAELALFAPNADGSPPDLGPARG